jgi:3-oxoadipate enol-lactonase
MFVGRLVLRLTRLWALWRLLGPRPTARFPAGRQSPDAPSGRTVAAGGHEFFVREAGPPGAPPVVLIHGWAYGSLATWHRVIPLLAGDLRVIAVDLRAHGKSDRVRERFEVEDLADDVEAVLDALGVGRVAVLGYSMGGMVAQALARRHPARVERLVLGATAARPWPRRVLVTGLLLAARALARLDPTALPRVLHRYLVGSGVIPPEHSGWLWETLLDRDVDLHHEAGFAIARFDSRTWVGRLAVPTLCLIPTRDQLVPPARQRDTAALIPGAQVTELEGARHEAIFTHAGEIAAAVLAFIGTGGACPGGRSGEVGA